MARKGEVNTAPDTSKQMLGRQGVNGNKPLSSKVNMKRPDGLKKSDMPKNQQDRDFDTP